MKQKLNISALLTLLLAFISSYVVAQQISTPAASPGSKTEQAIGLVNATIEYSRPSMKGRKIFGDLVPFDQVWRTGANSATKLTLDGSVTVGGKLLSAGSYAVLTKPGQSSWDVMFYPYETGNWAAYPDKTPLVTVKSAPTALPFNVETFTMGFGDLTNDGATLYLYWEKTFVSVPLSVDTKKTVMAQINKFAENPEATLGNAYNASAAYLLTEKENLELALKFATKAVEINPDAYWMSRTKALIEAELGKYKEAIASAQKSMAAAEKAGNQQYVDFNKASIAEWKKK